jgi:hypothetical protein
MVRPRLTYANVMTTIAIFLALGGATAFAANQLAKKSVGTKQLKANAVTAAKIKKNAVTKAKIKNGAVDGSTVLDGSVTGTNINGPSTPFSQVTARIRTTAQAPFTKEGIYPIGSYTQNAGEDAIYMAEADVTFQPGCEPPREAEAFLLKDAADPASLKLTDIAGIGLVEDKAGGTVTRRMEFSSFPAPGTGGMQDFAPASATSHSFVLLLDEAKCKSGVGTVVAGAGVDVIGTK